MAAYDDLMAGDPTALALAACRAYPPPAPPAGAAFSSPLAATIMAGTIAGTGAAALIVVDATAAAAAAATSALYWTGPAGALLPDRAVTTTGAPLRIRLVAGAAGAGRGGEAPARGTLAACEPTGGCTLRDRGGGGSMRGGDGIDT